MSEDPTDRDKAHNDVSLYPTELKTIMTCHRILQTVTMIIMTCHRILQAEKKIIMNREKDYNDVSAYYTDTRS